MDILYFHQHFSTPQGSTANRSYVMASKLVAHGHKVTMVCGTYKGGNTGLKHHFKHGKRSGVVNGINIIEYNIFYSNNDGFIKRTWLFLFFALRSIIIALFHKSDIIIATSTPLTASLPGIVARWLKGTKFVFEVRDLWPELPREMKVITNPVILWLMGVLEWISYKSAHRLIGLSPGIVEGIKRHKIAPEKVTLIPNGCDLDIFHSDNNPIRPKGISSSDFMAIFTGTHGIANGLDAVLDAAAVLLEDEKSNIKFVFVGQGRLKPHLQERVKNELLTNVIFLDPVSKKELAMLLAGANIGLQILANIPAFYYGTSPNKFFDYISAGLPVMTNYPGWIADLVNKNACGYVVPPEDPIAFAKALMKAKNNKTSIKTMGVNATSLANREFSREKLAESFVSWVVNTNSD